MKWKTTKEPIEAGKLYHLYNHAVANRQLFYKDKDYQFFLKRYKNYLRPYTKTFAYCLMPNHFHFLVKILEPHEDEQNQNVSEIEAFNKKVANALKNLLISYAKHLNYFTGTKGNLFIQKTKRKSVTDEQYLRELIGYIHFNPVYHGFVSAPHEWKFSSYNSYFSGRYSHIARDKVLQYFKDKDNFLFYHQMKQVEQFTKKLAFDE